MPEANEPIGIISLEGSLADAEKPKNLPAGKYIGEIIDVQQATSGKGNTYFSVLFVIPTDQFPDGFDADEAPDGVQLYWNRQLVPRGSSDRRTIWNLKNFVTALGLSADTNEIDPNDWMGQRAVLSVRMGKYQGEERPEIVSVSVYEAAAAPARAAAKRGRK